MSISVSTEAARPASPAARSAKALFQPRAGSVGRFLTAAARIVLGFLFLVCGLDGFLHFIPVPSEPMSSGAMAFGSALMQTGYMLPLVKGTEALAGALLLLNRKVPLALVLLAPVVVNIFAFHLFLAPQEMALATGIVVIQVYLAWAHRAAYRTLLAS